MIFRSPVALYTRAGIGKADFIRVMEDAEWFTPAQIAVALSEKIPPEAAVRAFRLGRRVGAARPPIPDQIILGRVVLVRNRLQSLFTNQYRKNRKVCQQVWLERSSGPGRKSRFRLLKRSDDNAKQTTAARHDPS